MADKLEIYGSKTLRQKSKEVNSFDETLIEFGNKLRKLMYEYDGVGIAAPQIGKLIRVIAVDIPNTEKESVVLVNPKIIWTSQETQTDSEGCLSIPDIRAAVNRPLSISVSAFSTNGEQISLEKISGFFARIIQHEMDHLDGILFTDKIDPLKRALLLSKLKKIAKERKSK
ncbi:MAG: peptide deformylase [Chitinispirillales bacterium]|jgi:peptide deformylase|nr:peptide deformylase [Chitinispirillales bacterium]